MPDCSLQGWKRSSRPGRGLSSICVRLLTRRHVFPVSGLPASQLLMRRASPAVSGSYDAKRRRCNNLTFGTASPLAARRQPRSASQLAAGAAVVLPQQGRAH